MCEYVTTRQRTLNLGRQDRNEIGSHKCPTQKYEHHTNAAPVRSGRTYCLLYCLLLSSTTLLLLSSTLLFSRSISCLILLLVEERIKLRAAARLVCDSLCSYLTESEPLLSPLEDSWCSWCSEFRLASTQGVAFAPSVEDLDVGMSFGFLIFLV